VADVRHITRFSSIMRPGKGGAFYSEGKGVITAKDGLYYLNDPICLAKSRVSYGHDEPVGDSKYGFEDSHSSILRYIPPSLNVSTKIGSVHSAVENKVNSPR
jgi:hypothetical protein